MMGTPELEHDPKFRNTVGRVQNAEELIAFLDRIFTGKPRAEWARLFKENGLIYAPVQTVAEVVTDPQTLANDYVVDYEHSEWGRVKVLGFPYRFSATLLKLEKQVPEFGQHTEEVLMEMGLVRDDITQLQREGII
ncbi:CoA transferase [Chloroflexota bacterium]